MLCDVECAGPLSDHVQLQGVPPVPEQAVLGNAHSVQQRCVVLHLCCHLHPYLHPHPPGTNPAHSCPAVLRFAALCYAVAAAVLCWSCAAASAVLCYGCCCAVLCWTGMLRLTMSPGTPCLQRSVCHCTLYACFEETLHHDCCHNCCCLCKCHVACHLFHTLVCCIHGSETHIQ